MGGQFVSYNVVFHKFFLIFFLKDKFDNLVDFMARWQSLKTIFFFVTDISDK
jgi:hypothetical protein